MTMLDDDVVMENTLDDDEGSDAEPEAPRVPLALGSSEPSSRIRTSESLLKQQHQQLQELQNAGSEQQPHFPKLNAVQASGVEYRRVRCPPHRYTPLREHWEQILTPLVEYLKLQVRLK